MAGVAGTIAVTEGSGKNLDTAVVSNVHREMVSIGDPADITQRAEVVGSPPNAADSALATREVGQKIWVAGFSDVGSSILDSGFTFRTAGTGIGYSQATGNLLITSGTTANSEFLARSVAMAQGAQLLKFTTTLSQRIAQNSFNVLLADKIGESLACTINSTTSITVTATGHAFTALNVGQFMFIGGISGAAGVPGRYAIASVVASVSITFTVAGWPASGSCTLDLFGWNHMRVLYDSTVATTANFDTQRNGWNNGNTAITISTTLVGHLVQVAMDGRNVFIGDTLTTSSITPATTTRGSRFTNIPDDTVPLYVYIWAFNGTTNPATTTTWTIGHTALENLIYSPVFIAGQRMQGTQSPAPVVTGAGSTIGTLTTLTNITNQGQLVDNALFTDGTTRVMVNGYIFDEVAGTALSENDAAAARIDSKRAQVMVIEDTTTRGQRLVVSAAGAVDIRQVGAYSFNNITTNVTTVVKGSAGTFRGITVNTAGTGSTATIYDNTAGSGTKIGTVNTAVLGTSLQFDAAAATGITVVTAGAGAADITVMFL